MLIVAIAVAILGNALQYFYFRTDIGFLLTKTPLANKFLYLPAFYFHIATGSVVVLAGLMQFIRMLAAKGSRLHKYMGRLYVVLILFACAPGGLLMAFHANGGFPAQLCFTLLACLWWYFTLRAWREIKAGNVATHYHFMLRSYALSLSAILLRLYSFLMVAFFQLRGEPVYVWIAWCSWVPNLIVVELYIHYLVNVNQKSVLTNK